MKKLLPHGHIELRFRHKHELLAAHGLLYEKEASVNEETMTLSVATDGSVKSITSILSLMEKSQIEIIEFTQKQPTLEDAYLSIVASQNRGI